MTRALRLTAWILALAALTCATGLVVGAAGTSPEPDESLPVWLAGLFLVGVAAPAGVGLVLIQRRPRLLVAWILLCGALSVAIVMAAHGVAVLTLESDPRSTLGRWAVLVEQEWPVLFLWPLALAYCFPDGRLPSPRWRPVAAVAFASSAGALGLLLLQRTPEGPYGPVASPLPVAIDQEVGTVLFWTCWFGLLASLFGGAAALFARYRAGDRLLQKQVLWLAYGALLLPLWLGGNSLWTRLVGPTGDADFAVVLLLQVWPAVAVAVAVTRHGLYAIDRLINRTLVYAFLTLLLAGTYAAVALLAGQVAEDSALVASVATLTVVLAFGPLRRRIQDAVDRRFAPARFAGVRLLREFLADVRDGRSEPEEVGAALAIALDDPRAEVLFRLPETGRYADRLGHIADALPDDGRARSPIGNELGLLLHDPALEQRPDLLRGVLGAAEIPVELARLRVELRLQLAEVRSSRERIAQAGYEERRRIERDLHDGAQQRLVALGIVLRRLQRSLPREARLLGPALDAAVGDVAAAIADLRTIAAGVRPPRLDDGLAAALEDLARGAPVPVEVSASGDRAPPHVEAAAYYVACEALTNSLKHAAASRVLVQASRTELQLQLVVSDDGVGGARPTGRGLAGMQDRVEAQGGTLSLDSPAGAGTRIAVELPCAS